MGDDAVVVDAPPAEDFDAFRTRLATVDGFEVDEFTVDLGDFLLLVAAVQAHEWKADSPSRVQKAALVSKLRALQLDYTDVPIIIASCNR